MTTDTIIIKDLELWCNIGIGEKERKEQQIVLFDIHLIYDLTKAGISDNIDDTINYSEVCKTVKNITEKEYHTLECLGKEITDSLKREYPVEKIILTIKKPRALKKEGAKYAAIRIER